MAILSAIPLAVSLGHFPPPFSGHDLDLGKERGILTEEMGKRGRGNHLERERRESNLAEGIVARLQRDIMADTDPGPDEVAALEEVHRPALLKRLEDCVRLPRDWRACASNAAVLVSKS